MKGVTTWKEQLQLWFKKGNVQWVTWKEQCKNYNMRKVARELQHGRSDARGAMWEEQHRKSKVRRVTWEEQYEKNCTRITVHKLQPKNSSTRSRNVEGAIAWEEQQHKRSDNKWRITMWKKWKCIRSNARKAVWRATPEAQCERRNTIRSSARGMCKIFGKKN